MPLNNEQINGVLIDYATRLDRLYITMSGGAEGDGSGVGSGFACGGFAELGYQPLTLVKIIYAHMQSNRMRGSGSIILCDVRGSGVGKGAGLGHGAVIHNSKIKKYDRPSEYFIICKQERPVEAAIDAFHGEQ